MSGRTVPVWAVQRVNAVVTALKEGGQRNINPAEVARRAGLSKSMVRQCLYQLERQ